VLSKLKLANKKNPRKPLEEIASCKIKYGVPVNDGKKVAQLTRLGGKKYGTVITVTQMCKKSEKVTCTAKHIVDEMWKQWRIEGGKEKGEENADDEDETTLSKVDEKSKSKGKDCSKDKDDKGKKKETRRCYHCQMKGHIEVNCWKKNPSLMPEKFKGKKTEKAGAAVEEEVLLSCTSEVAAKTKLMGHPVSSCHVPVVRSCFIFFHTLISSRIFCYVHLSSYVITTYIVPFKQIYIST